tara:strand:+ start:751 stop:858 length:108 start_codon:yes stop_codon:yes gene_type:complete
MEPAAVDSTEVQKKESAVAVDSIVVQKTAVVLVDP